VDLLPSYINIQIKGILAKEKSITINVTEFESPVVSSSTCTDLKQPNQNMCTKDTSSTTSNQSRGENFGGELDLDTDDENPKQNEPCIPHATQSIKLQ
jgi:hypothetical protein